MKIMTPLALLAASLLPLTASADLVKQQNKAKPMETITVTYREPTDYALYQYTTDMLVNFRLQIQADIYQQARTSIMKMANTTPYMSAMHQAPEQEQNSTE
ncbi:hypothetical protein [Shewanella woodyi]|uniref:Uncharacterized protein n=1 Tax=Shewanella woodyi (strain ATCC 51908 / MS32) TaxID=392500 RepID=B1KDV3_SHEWM|nr:hypothetical protein [Shewanella woodyi]ACA87955.1 conserved hypothetical protein [Shewanella woodyi ATCC 51908]